MTQNSNWSSVTNQNDRKQWEVQEGREIQEGRDVCVSMTD